MITTSGHSSRPVSRRRHRCSGISLPELLIGMAVSGIVVVAFISAFLFMTRSAFAVYSYAEMNAEGRRALHVLGEDLRAAVEIKPEFSNKELTVSVINGGEITYNYDPDDPDRTLTRTGGDGETRTLIRHIETFSFFYYDLQGAVAETEEAVKQIRVQISSARKGLGPKQSQDLKSARFVLRNRRVTN